MSIIGVTVGTPISPKTIEEKINPVKTVNGKAPDENGNVDVEVNANITEADPTVPSWAKQSTKPSYTKSEVGLGNVDNVKQYSASNPPPYPVTSVNSKTGAVTLAASDVGARPSTWTPTYSDVGADKSGTAENKVSAHNTNATAHNDLRLLIEGLTTRLNALANSDDTTLDQMKEIVDYIKSNRDLIQGITTTKINYTDIIDDLATNVADKPLSAAQGVVLKALIDEINDAGYLTSFTETDPTVPAWAKASSKPSYSKSEVGLGSVDNVKQYSASNPPPYPVTSVNGQTGAVTISVPSKVSELDNDSKFLTAVPSEYVTESELTAKKYLTSIPSEYVTETELNNKGYLTSHQDISGKADKSSAETWTFKLKDGSTVTKKVVLA